MNITINQSSLSKALSQVSKASSTKPTMPILANVLISLRNGVLQLYSTDLEIGIKESIFAENTTVPEDITVNSKLLTEFVNSLADSPISLQTEGTNLIVKNDSTKADFTTMKAKDFPKIPNISEEAPILEVLGKDFADAVKKTVFAVSTDMARPVLTGVLFDAKDAMLTLVAVDGYRLSKKEIGVASLPAPIKFIVPSRVLNEVTKIIGDGNDILKIFALKVDDQITQLVFLYNNIEINSRIVSGEYPDFRTIIPKEHTISFKIDRSILLASIKTSDTFARNIIGNKTIFSVSVEDKSVELKVTDPERGVLVTKMDIFEVEGQNMETAFNGRFLSEMLNSMPETNEIVFKCKAPGLPAEFINPKDTSYTHIIMPMRVS